MPSTASLFIVMIACASCGAAAIHRIDGTTIAPLQVDATVDRLLHAAQVTGAAIAIFEHGEPTYARTYGTRDGTRPLTPDSVMTAASLTKAAFAYLVMQLVDAGQLDLDRPIRLYLSTTAAASSS